MPSVKVTSGSNMHQEDRSLLIEKGIVQVDAGSAVALNEHMSITQVSKDTYVKEIRSHLMNAADAQKSYFAKNASYMSCAACTASVVRLTLLYIGRFSSESAPQGRSLQILEGFGCDCLDSLC